VSSDEAVTLHSSGLLSKWGFNDGDAPDAWFDYCDAHGVDAAAVGYPLAALVRRYLLPALAGHHDIEVYEVGTIHNPIRAAVVDGVDIDAYAASSDIVLTPASVTVPLADVLRIAVQKEGDGG